jgi:hypothetical protein
MIPHRMPARDQGGALSISGCASGMGQRRSIPPAAPQQTR